MSLSRTTFIAAIAAAMALAVNVSFAGTTFRGIPKASAPELQSSAFNALRPDHGGIFNVDIHDDFNRRGALAGSQSEVQTGFVGPRDMQGAQGQLTGQDALDHGTWSGGSYTTSNGRASGTGIASQPWRVTSDLGNFYLLDATANVADGETVSLGYFGDVDVTGTSDGLAGDLGLLVLNLTRTGTQVDWQVKWEGDIPGSVSGTAGQVALGQDVNLELGWMDSRRAGGPDLFEAWLDDTQLAAGDFGSVPSLGVDGNIDVFAAGFELSGPGSSIDSFAAAVPEPTSGLMGLMGFFALLGLRRRNG